LRVTWERGYGRPFEHAAECWIDRNGVTQWNGDRAGDWARVESDYPLAERIANNRKLGMSRHLAWIAARESLARDFAFWREYWRGAESWLDLSVRVRGPDGKTLAHDSIGGVESGSDYWRVCLLELAENCLAELSKHCDAEIAAARANVQRDRGRVRRLVGEIRALAGIATDAPEACATLRGTVSMLARSVGKECARIARARQALAAIESGRS
jgi:hypothetical protein